MNEPDNYEKISGNDELALFKHTGDKFSVPEYLLQDGYGNRFTIEEGERTEIIRLLEKAGDT